MVTERMQRQIDRLLDEAEAALSKSNWPLVRDRAQNVLALDPNNADAKGYLASADRALAGVPVGTPRDAGEHIGSPLQTSAASAGVSPSPVPSPPSASLRAGSQGEGQKPTPTPAPAHPASFASGRYAVRRFLGEGGKKKVYLAHDNTLDRDVAFALIKTAGLDEVAKVRITREAQAMGRLGSHPNIVTVFELGSVHPPEGEEGQPYIVTELMGGGDVEGLIEKATGHKMPLERALKIATETCRGLEFAHARNIIHRDLKPGNVWLTADGPSAGSGQAVAKIGDFGLAVAIDRSRLTSEGMMVGTVSYMPPEQAMGGEVTPRSDLYSLGAMLYEMVTGRPPFLGDSPVAIIGQHINTPPVAPTWHNAECPRALEALIMRLLAKDPKERPASAADVRKALEAVDVHTVGVTHASPLPGEKTNVLDSVAGGVFVGRQREMGELRAALEDTLGGKGRMVALVGEPGIGKTRTSLELATYAGLRQAQVLWGRCYEAQGVPPYWPWVQAIRSYVREKPAQQVRTEMGSGAADIAEVVSDVKDRLPDLPKPAPMDPEQARFRLFDSIAAFLKSASKAQPIVLILDDLHWADRPSLLLLEFVAREIGTSRVLLVGTYRDVEVSRRSPLALTLGELTRERLYQRVLLRGLSKEDVGKFIEQAAGMQPPAGLVDAVYTQTEGNPFFVTEVVRLLTQEGALTGDVGAQGLAPLQGTNRRADQTDTWAVRIPEGVREVIGRRLDRLSERCNGVLTIAAVVGREFSLQQLEALTRDAPEAEERLSGDRLLEVVEEALSARVIEELPRAVGRYQFTHALIQETLAGELSTTRKVRLHARIAEAMEKLYGRDAEAHAPELAYHFAEAQTLVGSDKLVKYSLLAGEKALTSYAWEEAIAHFTRVLEAKGTKVDDQRAKALHGLGFARAYLGQVEEAWQHLREAFEVYMGIGDVAGAVAVAQHPLAPAGRYPGLAQMGARALKLVPEMSATRARLLGQHGQDLGVAEGNYAAGMEALNQALAMAESIGDRDLESRIWARISAVEGNHMHWQKCIEIMDRHSVGGWAVEALIALGAPQKAKDFSSRNLQESQRTRSRGAQANTLGLVAATSRALGEWSEARKSTDEVIALATTFNMSMAIAVRSLVEQELGNFGEAKTYQEHSLEAVASQGNRATILRGGLALALAMAARIGPASYHDFAVATAESILADSTAVPVSVNLARSALALFAVADGDKEAAGREYAGLLAHKGMMAGWGFVSNDRVLGLLAHTMGDHDAAAQHFEDAIAFCRKAGYRPELAWSLCDYADLLRERASASVRPEPVEGRRVGRVPIRRDSARTGEESDRQHAARLLDESLRIASELGMKPLMARVLARREILKA